MGSAIFLGNIVGKTEDMFRESLCPLQGAFQHNSVAIALDMANRRMQRFSMLVQVFNKSFDATTITKSFFLPLR